MSLDVLQHFSETYAQAREKFLRVCRGADATMDGFKNPKKGPEGGELSTDIACFGPRDAERLLLVMSGTHGVECMAGSSAQIGWVASGAHAQLPPRTAVLLVHMINPYGAAWQQQETEESVNLNRKFVDPAAAFPAAPLYAQIHEAVMCPDLSGPRFDAAEAVIADYRKREGLLGYQKALFGGQYDHPKGMNFGGHEPTWSNRTFIDILKKHASKAHKVIFLDFHTGLGPYGYASLITFCRPSDPLFARVSEWFGPTAMAVLGDETAAIAGHTGSAVTATLQNAEVTPVTVEFGTFDVERECRVVRQDLWLRNFGDRKSEQGRKIKHDLVSYFYPEHANWKETVWYRGQQVIRNA